MNSLSSKLNSSLFLSSPVTTRLVSFLCTHASSPPSKLQSLTTSRRTRSNAASRNSLKGSDVAVLKENWLDSLSCPLPEPYSGSGMDSSRCSVGSDLVLGVDPDVSGAIAVLRTEESGLSAQVFDSPRLPILVGNRVRRRLDAKSIVQLLRGFDAPIGTTAYLEQSIPYPQDGKQGWWSGGFGYGLWIGILVASGFSVVPVPSSVWKNEFQLSGSSCPKDDSRRVASTLFPSLSSQLKRKKDHGRAEALLIAAYGKGLATLKPPVNVEELVH